MADDTFYVTPTTGEGGGVADSVAWADVTGKPSFATVALTGAFSDLTTAPIAVTGSGSEVVDLRITDGSEYINWGFTENAASGSRGTLQVDHVYARSIIARDEQGESMTGLAIGETNIPNGKMGIGDVTAAADQITLFSSGNQRLRLNDVDSRFYGPVRVEDGYLYAVGGQVAADLEVTSSGNLGVGMGLGVAESAVHIRGARDVSGSEGIHMGTDNSGGYGIELVSGDGTGMHGFYIGTSGDRFKGRIEYNLWIDQWEVSTREFSDLMNWSNAALNLNRTVRIAVNTGIEFQGPTEVNIRSFEDSLTDASNAIPTSYAVKNYVDRKTGTFSFYTSSDRLDSSGIGMTWNGFLGTAIEGSWNHQSEWAYDPIYVTASGVLNPHVFDTNCPCLQLATDEWAGCYRIDFDAHVVSMEQSKASLIPFCYLNGYDSSSSLPIDSSGILKTDASHMSCKIECDSLKIDGGRSGSFHGVVEMSSGDTVMISAMLSDETTSGRSFIDYYPHNRQVSKFSIRSHLTLTYLG